MELSAGSQKLLVESSTKGVCPLNQRLAKHLVTPRGRCQVILQEDSILQEDRFSSPIFRMLWELAFKSLPKLLGILLWTLISLARRADTALKKVHKTKEAE